MCREWGKVLEARLNDDAPALGGSPLPAWYHKSHNCVSADFCANGNGSRLSLAGESLAAATTPVSRRSRSMQTGLHPPRAYSAPTPSDRPLATPAERQRSGPRTLVAPLPPALVPSTTGLRIPQAHRSPDPGPYKGHHNGRREDQTGSGQAGTRRMDPGSLRAIFSLVFPAPALGAIGVARGRPAASQAPWRSYRSA